MTNIEKICKILAFSYVDNFDIESEEITICGFSTYHGLALIATYYDSGVPKLHLISFNDEDLELSLEGYEILSVRCEDVPVPLVRSYDNALRLFLLAAGSDLHCIHLFGLDDLGFNRFDCSKLLDDLYS